jgi:hypothetical protein
MDMEEAAAEQFDVLSWHFLGGTEGNNAAWYNNSN